MSSTVTTPAVRPYSSTTTASELCVRRSSASSASSGLVSGTISASRTSPSMAACGPSETISRNSELAWMMPRTWSRFASSVITSRVWPESMQRLDAVSASSEMSTLTTLGAGFITWRACCSWSSKTPESIPASPVCSWPRSSDPAISSLRSSGVPPSSNSAEGSTWNSLRIAVRGAIQHEHGRAERPREQVQGTCDPQRHLLGARDRHDLRDLLADRDVESGRDHVSHDEAEGQRHAARQGAPQPRVDQRRDRRLPEEPDADRGERDPELAGRQVLADLVELPQRQPGRPVRLQLLQPRAAGPHQRELGRHEEPVHEHQHHHADEQQSCHRGSLARQGTGCLPRLRGGASSFIRAPPARYQRRIPRRLERLADNRTVTLTRLKTPLAGPRRNLTRRGRNSCQSRRLTSEMGRGACVMLLTIAVAGALSVTALASVLVGTGGPDVLVGTTGPDQLYGEDGSDVLRGLGGNDYLEAGPGEDSVEGAGGVDLLIGGTGDDRLDGAAGNDVIYAGAGDDTVLGGRGADTIFGQAGDDRIFGGSGRDRIWASLGADFVDGGSGSDRITAADDNATIVGGSGNDMIMGGGGNMTVRGGPGRDRIRTGAGDDHVRGGTGADRIATGAGDDRVNVRDGRRDRVNCGRGRDVAIADLIDRLAGCEVVRLPAGSHRPGEASVRFGR